MTDKIDPQIFEINAHGWREINSTSDIISDRISIPENFKFITFTEIGNIMYSDYFNSLYNFSRVQNNSS